MATVKKYNLKLFDVEKITNHGGSLRYYICKKKGNYKSTSRLKKILNDAIKLGGTTLKDFYSADGNKGYFNIELNVYGKEDENCKNCKSKIERTLIGQRATYSCNKCQI